MVERECVYLCDPEKNDICRKTACQKECKHTTHKEFSLDGKKYKYNDFYHRYEEVHE